MKWLENMVLQSKLMLLTGVMVVAMMVLGYMGFNATAGWQSDIVEIGDVRVPSLVSVGTIRNGTQLVAIQMNRVRGLKGNPALQDKMANASDEIQKGFDRIDKGMKIYEPLPQTPEEATEWKVFKSNYETWRKESEKFQKEIVEGLAKTNDPVQIEALFNVMTAKIEAIRSDRIAMTDSLQKVYDINKDVIDKTNKVAKEESTAYKQMFMVVAVVSILFAVLLAWVLIRSITRSITQSVTSIRDGAMQITSASDQVAASSSSLAQGASEQASSVEEVSATLEESTAINTQNTDNARQADILARNANDSAKAGYEKGEQLSHSMHAITESAAKISGIIKTIDQIAFQTNLLALNAAVEAARAGEHGLGFAVVADEVRNLAQRAASAAKETSVIIEEVVGQIKEGNQIALATHTSFQEIVEQSKKVSDLIGEIAIAGKEQAEGMGQINQAMGQVDQVTQQVAANSEEAAAAAEELNAQATSMMETVRILAKMVGMESDAPAATARKVNLHRLDPNPIIAHRTAAPKHKAISSKADEIFPLHEDDLKEF
ncbi:MAG: methyl-accepting chemotaxis protein [Sulfuricurvum sp.]|uniref:methyl-accepting chemotaxis protein n=1 Tax=Sulfuricurvum sp. TaxID=2025608 RepID=UPI002620C88A|nr:methyl-accepting chemotaxis protein [Sulfuricurvum sp.]MDD2950417.1 methyl-accepting chemotaxis protein [Sulfuricurvum sp.]MDD5118656.1 methyl-accepting chemotaxis protein [Sulfuricurvum sp.]